jgi:transposase
MVAGIDCHKKSHVVCLLGDNGECIATTQVKNDQGGFDRLVGWFEDYGALDAVIGVENANGYGQSLAQTLDGAGFVVLNVPGFMTARERLCQGPGKSDERDALAIAEITLRRQGKLGPGVRPEPVKAIALLETARRGYVKERVQQILRLRMILSDIDPAFESTIGGLSHPNTLQRIKRKRFGDSPSDQIAKLCTHQLVCSIVENNRCIKQTEDELGKLLDRYGSPLAALPGAGPITTATVIAHAGDIRRFPNAGAFASFCGVAPIPCGSGKTNKRHRLNPYGNRQLNAALHRIALTQIRCYQPAKTYIQRKQDEGKTKREAIRALKRHLANTTYKHLKTWADQTLTTTPHP